MRVGKQCTSTIQLCAKFQVHVSMDKEAERAIRSNPFIVTAGSDLLFGDRSNLVIIE